MGLRGAAALIVGLGVFAPVMVLASPKAAAVAQTPSRTPNESPGPCSAGAIRLAAAKQSAPALTGCRYEAVAGPVAQFFLTLPVARKTDDQASPGTIVAQNPEAGQPLKPGGRLVLNVSTGRPPKAGEETPANPASEPASSLSESGSPVSSSSAEPVPGRPTVPTAEPAPQPEMPVASESSETPSTGVPSITPEPSLPPIPAEAPEVPWLWIAGAVALIVLLAAAVGALFKRGGSRGGGLIAPAVSLRLVPGEARLKTRSALVSGRKGRS
ncbi:PASTA domain-containing protein [Asticcacaulis sp. AND118]|uniref:PASTA domain-containing protein n=1 Tax=Asticcacaulis sp. AND118 TaxID=2840468 RepID=UPI001CFF8933|nr:PASTA domain-containing protein [Asticcacaulis sp. AND118]UDF03114.1 PASTA domain-containing protein [Asticcacaulis sp. AND118]